MTSDKQRDDGGSAFPVETPGWNDQEEPRREPRSEGMTLRDWFAGQALAEVIEYSRDRHSMETAYPKDAARVAYLIADAMIAERSAAKVQS